MTVARGFVLFVVGRIMQGIFIIGLLWIGLECAACTMIVVHDSGDVDLADVGGHTTDVAVKLPAIHKNKKVATDNGRHLFTFSGTPGATGVPGATPQEIYQLYRGGH